MATMQAMVGEVRQLRQELSSWASSLRVDYHAGSAEAALTTRQKLKSEAGLTK